MNETRLRGRTLVLEPMTEAFATERYLGWLRDPEVNYFILAIDLDLEGLRAYVRNHARDPNCRFWAVCDEVTGTHIGNIKLIGIDWNRRVSNFGIMIGDRTFWGRGVATEATRMVLEEAFGPLELDRVELNVKAANAAAHHAYERAGFRVERVIKDDPYRDGKIYDVLLMAATASGRTPA